MDYENQIILNSEIKIKNKKEENGIIYEEVDKVEGEANYDLLINWPQKKFGKIVNTTAHQKSINGNKNCLELEKKTNNNNNITNDPSFDISVYIINKSIRNVKKCINNLKKIINNYYESECENLYNDLKSECSSIVKTMSNFGDVEISDEKSNGENSCSENIDKTNIEVLIQAVINKKKEEKKFTTLDIIDECLSIGKIYNKRNKINDIINNSINTVTDQQNLLYSQHSGNINSKFCNIENMTILNNKTDINNSLNINELDFQKCVEDISMSSNVMPILYKDKINNNSLNKLGGKYKYIIPDSCNPINYNLSKNKNDLNIEKNTSILPEYLYTSEKTEGNNESTNKHLNLKKSEICENYKITDYLEKIKGFIKIGKGDLSYDNTGIFLKRKKKLTALLRPKKRISYFVLHMLLFFSYAILGFSFIFIKRIIYKIFFDQDL
ncbi:conserved Plasmodium protein, unknown function [Plasmodium berghei]|uniref:Uncharacterized protein n=2 Tax=Plasmodium berghei TaxID=5821 RepID=A0A509APX2_PLABA|nr:conserved Plasmodium protein, unknown function [Plasmodium berghei ANKA]CXI42740.1 conserved Plasmodium protein, unknown function [Plasmodium berghei]SCM22179.1 conserved Plasmodium protein, unknown function [Plasmodium berghei]SCN25320.1 conserved Plasmodium protein, unknown function [Plasmodium berghei]SCO60292.1 conserved Plasmodium protein, unknown function [Plasmodium berghei]SCO61978.1 conserved Plasmodium protein, unknown function [Plasmodium berghei]|eukprot:XP_034421557.1 conserved Plasmodium protein, unknown function [Plasmodium berghei ANKA]